MTLPKNVDGLRLTILEREIALALIEPKIKDLTVPEVGLFMDGLIHKTYLNAGVDIKKNKEVIDLTIDELIADLMKYNGTLSLSELKIAFTNGYKGEYGEYFGLNNKTYFQWVNAYCFGEKRLRVRKTLLEAKEKEGREPEKKSEEEIEMIMQDACLKSFDDFRRGVTVFDGGNVKYKYLLKKGLLNLSDDDKKRLKGEAEEKLKQVAIDSKSKTETIQKALSRVTEETVQSEARKLALLLFYQRLVQGEFELSDLLTD